MKKEKMKYYLKKNLISFVIGLILFGSLGAYAIVTFQSKDVSYENKSSGLSSNNVQGAIDELYEECTKVPAPGDTILDSVDVVTSGDGLYEDTYEEGRYFYKGVNVNNYITFNNEVWRIVSIEPDKTIKIMRNASIGDRASWDEGGESYGNNWARPTTLNTYLNGSYLTESLNSTAQSQIVSKDWSIGAVTYENNDLADQINDENGSIWNGKVALITMSEYIRSNSNQDSCGTYSLNQSNYSSCKNTTWMQNAGIYNWWILSPFAGSAHLVFQVFSDGNIFDTDGGMAQVRPSVYLSSSVKIVSGDGSQTNPYQIEI